MIPRGPLRISALLFSWTQTQYLCTCQKLLPYISDSCNYLKDPSIILIETQNLILKQTSITSSHEVHDLFVYWCQVSKLTLANNSIPPPTIGSSSLFSLSNIFLHGKWRFVTANTHLRQNGCWLVHFLSYYAQSLLIDIEKAQVFAGLCFLIYGCMDAALFHDCLLPQYKLNVKGYAADSGKY